MGWPGGDWQEESEVKEQAFTFYFERLLEKEGV